MPKPGKDPLDTGSYRPISLIDVDQKTSKKKHGGQTSLYPSGFDWSMACGFLRKVLSVLDRVKQRPLLDESPALDAEKAFNNVRWSWLNLVLDKVGLTGHFQVLLAGIYINPTGQISTPGYIPYLNLSH